MKKSLPLNDFIDKIRKEKIVLFGSASRGKRVLNNLILKGIKKKQVLFCDNNKNKWGTKINDIKVISINQLQKMDSNTCIIVSSSMYSEIILQLESLGFVNVHYYHNLLFTNQLYEKYDTIFLKILQKIKDRCYMDSEELYTLYSSMKAVKKLSGDIVEVGVYKGGSARLLCEMKGNKSLFLFDTFEGLPKTNSKKDLVKQGWLNNTTLPDVQKYLKNYKQVYFFQGIFPQTAKEIVRKKFSLVHLDTDLYQSTLDGLKFFWPKMTAGGRIICHDYNAKDVGGVRKAFDEFFIDKREKIIEIADTQVMVIK